MAAGAYGAYDYATRGTSVGRAIRPSQILPAQVQAGAGHGRPITLQGGPQRPTSGRTPSQPRLALPGPGAKSQTTPPTPIRPPAAPVKNTIQQNANLVANIHEVDKFDNIIANGYDVATTASILRKVLPKTKVDLLERVEGGLEQVLNDYYKFRQENPPAVRQQTQPASRQQNQPPEMQAQQMPEMMQQTQRQQAQPQGQTQIQPEQAPEITPEIQEQLEPVLNRENVNERVSQISPASKMKLDLQSPQLRKESFAVPNYRMPYETKKEFSNRKVLIDAINKTAKALTEGKSFLDFPINEKTQLSTASDVLSFIAGIPNKYEYLLDEDEKEELSEGFAGSKDGNIYGAQMTPNLVWNLLVTLEPRITKMEKPKGIKGQISPGKKMGTTELRRNLTHAVYGVLSGQTISTKLADKIERISDAASYLDKMVTAAQMKNFKTLDDLIIEFDKINPSALDDIDNWVKEQEKVKEEYYRKKDKESEKIDKEEMKQSKKLEKEKKRKKSNEI